MGVESQRAIIEDLRDRIRRIERRPARREGFLPSGRPEVDALLPGGGFPRAALADLAGGPASGKTLLALAVIGSAVAEGGLGAFVDGRGELYPPAAQALGVDLDRLLVVRPGPREAGHGGQEGLWAAEALLASGAFAAVAVDVPVRGLSPPRLEAMLRRLAAAAEKGGAAGLWLGPPDLACRVPAAVRLEVLPGERGGVRVRRAPGRGAEGVRTRGTGHAA
jgi:protein ImuA